MTETNIRQVEGLVAIRYGDENGNFDAGAPARIAQFVLGHDVDTRVTVLNERLTAVVQPVNEFWNPEKGLADLSVTDPKTGGRIALSLGQWLARYPNGALRPLAHNLAMEAFAPEIVPPTFRQELAQVINRHSKESGSNTPDHILAVYLEDVLRAFDGATNRRKDWNAR